MHTLYGYPRYFKFKRKYQQYGSCFQTIFPFLITMCEVGVKEVSMFCCARYHFRSVSRCRYLTLNSFLIFNSAREQDPTPLFKVIFVFMWVIERYFWHRNCLCSCRKSWYRVVQRIKTLLVDKDKNANEVFFNLHHRRRLEIETLFLQVPNNVYPFLAVLGNILRVLIKPTEFNYIGTKNIPLRMYILRSHYTVVCRKEQYRK